MRKLITLLALFPSLAGGSVLAQCELHPSGSTGGSQPGEGFGSAVAVSGSTLIVGAPHYDCSPTKQECGAVYGPGWSSFGPNAEDNFGASVAASGEIAIVGAPGDNYCQPSGGDCGRAYVFRNGVLEANLGGFPAYSFQAFGYAVAAAPGVVAASAPFDLCSPHTPFCGTVRVLRYNAGSQSWMSEAKLQPSDLVEDGEFGSKLSLDGNVLAVGARYGKAYVFRFNGTSWIEEKRLANPNYYY